MFIRTPSTKPVAPVKTFYFGMNDEDLNNSSGTGSDDNQEVERFAASIQRRVPPPTTPTNNHIHHHHTNSGSDSLSSDPNCDEVCYLLIN